MYIDIKLTTQPMCTSLLYMFLMPNTCVIHTGSDRYTSPLSLPVAGKCLIALGGVGIICILFTLLKEYNFFMKPR